MPDADSGVLLSLDRGKTWSRSKIKFASELGIYIQSWEDVKIIGLPNLKKIYAGQLMSSDFGRYWRKANTPELIDEYDRSIYSMVYVSSDGQRKLIEYENDGRPNFLKSWVERLISSGSTELVYVGSGNWVARFFENQTE
jgi:hypothetical protein